MNLNIDLFPFRNDNFIPVVCLVLMDMFVFQCVHAVWLCALACYVETGSVQTQFPFTAGTTFQHQLLLKL